MLAMGSGVADASGPDVVGKKYSDAQSAISSAGMTPVVQVTTGDKNAWPDCIVTRTQVRKVAPPANTTGSEKNEMLVSLNCDAGLATASDPGVSAASPEGQQAKKKEEATQWLQTPDGQKWCAAKFAKDPKVFPVDGCPQGR